MGQVFRARDTRLNRDVAIKILPDAFANDPDRVARFGREAESLAALGHPNIAQVYGVEIAGDGRRAIVMEFVDGPPLADVIRRGPVPLPEALAIARQILLALETAHDRGIVHRDLKPANIALEGSSGADDSVVKVLDFGLAKHLDRRGDSQAGEEATITSAGTEAGVILGTPAYMAPEQARGRAIDRRVDIWAFGCVLYEMLTGRAAFGDADTASTLVRILERDPEWDALPPDTPLSIRRLLRRCLAKDRRERLADAADARLEIDDAIREPHEGSGTTPATPRAWWKSAIPWPIAAIAAALAFALMLMRDTPSPAPVTRVDLALPYGDRFVDGGGLAWAPDGRTVFYNAERGGVSYVFRRSLNDSEAAPIRGTEGALSVFVLPRGDQLLFATTTPEMLSKVPIAGGPAAPVAEVRTRLNGIDVVDERSIVFGDHGRGLLRAPLSGGAVEPGGPALASGAHRFPVVLPDRRGLLLTIGSTPAESRIAVLPAGATEPRTLVPGTYARYLTTGQLLFWRAGSVWAAPFDLQRLEISGEAVPVVNNARIHGSGAAAFAVASTGALAYIPAVDALQNTLVWVDRRGVETPLPATPGPYVSPRLSPDGQRVLLTYRSDATEDIWLHDVTRGVTEPFIAEPESEWDAAWTADGEHVLFSSRHTGRFHVYATRANGLGQPEQLIDGVATILGATPDGRGVLLPRHGHLVVVGLSDNTPRPLFPREGDVLGAQFSPDGRWIAYAAADAGGRHQIWVRPYPKVEADRWRVSADGGRFPRWSRDGGTIFYRRGTSMMAVRVRGGDRFSYDAPVVLFEGPYAADYDLARDGRFLMIKESADPPIANRIIVVLNWAEELRARVAVGK